MVPLTYDFAFKRLFLNGKIRKEFISDVLGIPPDEIRLVRLADPFLWKWHYREKQRILDVLMEVNGDRRVNVELQVRVVACWDGRSLFYLAKPFTERLLAREDYNRMRSLDVEGRETRVRKSVEIKEFPRGWAVWTEVPSLGFFVFHSMRKHIHSSKCRRVELTR